MLSMKPQTTTRLPLLLRFAEPFGAVSPQSAQLVATGSLLKQGIDSGIQARCNESRFTRVKSETTDDE